MKELSLGLVRWFITTALEAGKSKIKAPADAVSAEDLPGLHCCLLPVSSCEKQGASSLGAFYKGTNPIAKP